MGGSMAAHGLLLPGLVTGTAVALWATALLPEFLTALLFLAAAMILHVASAEVIFSGFASDAFWLVLSGYVLGAAIRKVGLADRAAGILTSRLSATWPRLVGGTVLMTYGLAFVMPSNMGRIALLMPIVNAVADRAGLPEGGRGRIGLALAVGFGTFQLSASILPANVPNLVMAGTAESAYGLHFDYLAYLALHAPVLGVLKGIALAALIVVLFPEKPRPSTELAPQEPFSADERRLSILLAATLALWATDRLHGIDPAWIGLASACLCLLPRIGFVDGEGFAAAVNLRTCLYIAGILGFAAVVARSGLGDAIGRTILPLLPLESARPFQSFGALVGLTGILDLAVTANGVPALYTPLAQTLSGASGLPLATVLMVQVIGYATPLLPYQAAPIVVAMDMGRVRARDGAKLCLALAAVTFLLFVPLDYVWFRALGWIGSPP